MAIEKIHFTSESAKDTQDKLNANFSEIDTAISGIPTKTSDLTNDGDGNSNFATESYVDTNGGKIDSISVNNVAQTIDANKNVDITVPTKTSDITNDSGFITKSVNDLTNYYTQSQVDAKISAVYKPAGSVAFGSLPALSSSVLGNVYNLTDSFTTTSDFVEGAGNTHPAGTNVVVVNTGTAENPTYKFDCLSGFVDLSGYVPTSRKVNNKALSSDITLTASDVGAQSTIDSSHKLSADLVDDTSTTNKFVTASDKTTWDGKQNAITEYSFTSSDAGWSALTNGYYTLTITSAKKPFVCYNSSGEQVMAGLKYDGTYIYVITDTKFSGSVWAF